MESLYKLVFTVSGKINYYLANAKSKESRESVKGKNASDWALQNDAFCK